MRETHTSNRKHDYLESGLAELCDAVCFTLVHGGDVSQKRPAEQERFVTLTPDGWWTRLSDRGHHARRG